MDLISLLVYIVVWGIVIYVLWWGIGKIGLPEPFNKIAVVVLVLLTIVVLLTVLFGVAPLPRLRLGLS